MKLMQIKLFLQYSKNYVKGHTTKGITVKVLNDPTIKILLDLYI